MKNGAIALSVFMAACPAFAAAGTAMPAIGSLTPVDWILLGLLALLAGIGLFRGISGELGSLAGLVAAIVVGVVFFGISTSCAKACSFGRIGAVVIDFLFAIIAFGTARILVRKFVSFLMGKPADCTLGLLSGLFKGAVVLALVSGIGILPCGTYSSGILTGYSKIVRTVAAWADSYGTGENE